MSKGNILIAEDDDSLRSLYMKKFATAGYSIRTAEDGQQALDAINEESPDVLLLDIHMPKLDGFDVLEQLPKEARNFPVIMLTNFADSKTKKKGSDLGADDYFVKKDMTMKKLLDMTEHVMNIRRFGK